MRIKIHVVIGAVRAARNGDRRIPISAGVLVAHVRAVSIVYFRFARPSAERSSQIIPLRNSRTIPSAKLIFQTTLPLPSGIFRRKSPFIPSRLSAFQLDFPEQQPTDSGKKMKGERRDRGERGTERGVARKHGGGPVCCWRRGRGVTARL